MRFTFLLLFLLGCQGDVWHVDKHFTYEQAQSIRQAAEDWQIAVGVPIDLVFGSTVDLRALETRNVIVAEISTDKGAMEFAGADVLGIYSNHWAHGRIMIYVDELTELPHFHTVITHELGHSLGLPHTLDPHAVMYPAPYLWPQYPNNSDRSLFCAKHPGWGLPCPR